MYWIIGNPAKSTAILVAVALIPLVLAAQSGEITTLAFKKISYDTLVNILTPIFVVALLIERAVEVFVVSSRKIERSKLEMALQLSQEKLSQLADRIKVFQAQLDSPIAREARDEQVKAVQARINNVNGLLPSEQKKERNAAAKLEAFRAQTRPLAYFAAVVLGLFVALAGMRVIAPLVDLKTGPEALGGLQAFTFHALDVVLTAGLLAGGASGIHQIISVFGEFTAKARRNVAGS